MQRISRRRFLNQSIGSIAVAGAGASLVQAGSIYVPKAVLGSSILGANERIRLGVIGAGGHGRHDMMTFYKVPGESIECVVVCDVDDAQIGSAVKTLENSGKSKPDTVKDFRKVCERKDVDIIQVSAPDHWHPLMMIEAVRAGKDVYCEKPLANSIGESKRMLDWARKTDRVVQMGTQWRMSKHHGDAVKYVQSGKLGRVRMVRCWACLAWFKSVGKADDMPAPPGVDYDMWLGPAPKRAFNPKRFHFNFRWFWDYAGGLMTDWGVHVLNIALWGMNASTPKRVSSSGGKYAFDDIGETPDTQCAMYDYGDFILLWEHQAGTGHGPNGREHGIAFYGTNGTLTVDGDGWQVEPEAAKKDEFPAVSHKREEDGEHCRVMLMKDFIECTRSRKRPQEDIELGHFVTSIAHLGNLALRTGRSIEYNAEQMTVSGNEQANAMITNPYRAPWKLPEL